MFLYRKKLISWISINYLKMFNQLPLVVENIIISYKSDLEITSLLNKCIEDVEKISYKVEEDDEGVFQSFRDCVHYVFMETGLSTFNRETKNFSELYTSKGSIKRIGN